MGLAYNAMSGALILGKSHQEGGIHLLQPISEDRLRYTGEMEGWEYLSPPLTDPEIIEKFKAINEKTKNDRFPLSPEFTIPTGCKILDASKVR